MDWQYPPDPLANKILLLFYGIPFGHQSREDWRVETESMQRTRNWDSSPATDGIEGTESRRF